MLKHAKILWARAAAKNDYWLTRFVMLRALGFVYFFAFLSLAAQVIPLIGHNGLLPADNFLAAVENNFGSAASAFQQLPTIFFFHSSDPFMQFMAWAGVAVSLAVVIGFANVPIMSFLWFLYMSFVHIGQLWYGYGWEIQLLETGFLAIFLCPLLDPRPFPRTPVPVPVIWLFRWLAFRFHLGSGLIKLRGDVCWRELTCLFNHFETQPIPNPLSPWFHFMPKFFLKLGVQFTHIAMLIAPFFAFGPRFLRIASAIILLSFQFILILGGNYSFLNWITIVPVIALFDDKFLRRFLPGFITRRADEAARSAKPLKYRHFISVALVIAVIWLSIPVVQNLFSSSQVMNTSFNQLSIVNTYGAFGSVGRERYELVVEGTNDAVLTENTVWKHYEFRAKPTSVNRALPVIAPYQPRIDWQIWFAAMQRPEHNPWLVHLVWKFLHNDEGALSLISYNPFPDAPPRFIRIDIYRYEFAEPWKEDAVWKRQRLGTWLPALSMETPGLGDFIRSNNWNSYES